MNFKLIEPLNKLFKDEVRALVQSWDYQKWYGVNSRTRTGIRVLGEITEESVRDSDLILREEIRNAGLERDIWHTCLPNIPLIGVMGRTNVHTTTQSLSVQLHLSMV